MSLILSGSKTVTIAGTEMNCLEIYEQEAYTIPFFFVDDNGQPVDCTDPTTWTLSMSAKWYTATVTYSGSTINIGTDLALVTPQPSPNANLVAAFTAAASGEGYIYVPTNISGTTLGTTPILAPNPTTLVVTTMTVTRTDLLSGLNNVSREPLGFIIRYQ